MPENNKIFCVISHTHWDREWYMPFSQFRLRLVDLIDRMLVIFEENEEYIFHLDAQTIVLEDYLEIRPSKRKILEEYIAQGRLIVGPWYLQNDFYLTSGEATIRNLIEGNRIANEFGKCSKTGYAPDQFGNISQLPQILSGFGIDNFIFGRGYGRFIKDENGNIVREKVPTEFIWEGADGTKLLAIHMKYWYNNAQRFSADIERAKILIDVSEHLFEDFALTPYLLMMNGVDHLEAQDDLLPILEKLNNVIDGGRKVVQTSLDSYVNNVRTYINGNNIEMHTHKGELRDGHDGEILQGTLSSRHYLKVSNVNAQNMLECCLEPLYTFYGLCGAKKAYSHDHFRYIWKELMKNHPHDSICGCSRDEVHAHMEDNFAKLSEMANELKKRIVDDISSHMQINTSNKDDNVISVINVTEAVRKGVIRATVTFLSDENVQGFSLTDQNGSDVKFAVISEEEKVLDVFSPINLPGCLDVKVFEIYIYLDNISPMSAKGLLVKKTNTAPAYVDSKPSATILLDNEYLTVSVSKDGIVDITDKSTSRVIKDAIDIEQSSDVGDSYIYFGLGDEKYGKEFTSYASMGENNEYVQSALIHYDIKTPKNYDFALKKHSDECVTSTLELTLTLEKGSDVLELDYTVDNKASDHRIRILVNTNIKSSISFGDIPFDVVEHGLGMPLNESHSKAKANTSFAAIEGNGSGVCVFTQGAHEYEHLINRDDTLAFTILRATAIICRNYSSDKQSGAQWECPQNQCIRSINGRLGISAFTKKDALPLKSKLFRNKPIAGFAPCNKTKYLGGRVAVQDTRLTELFYLDDPYKNVVIKDSESIYTLDNNNITVTAFKLCEDQSGYIIRICNYSNSTQNAVLCLSDKNLPIGSVNLDESGYTGLAKGSADISLKPKQIATYKIG